MLINNIPPGLSLIAPAVPVSPSDNDDAIPCISTDAAANKYVPYSAYSHGGTTTSQDESSSGSSLGHQ